MSIVVTPDSEATIRKLIETGRYRDSAAVVDDALAALEDRDRLHRLRAAIASGDAQYARGETVPLTAALVEQMKRDADLMARRGEAPNPDVRD